MEPADSMESADSTDLTDTGLGTVILCIYTGSTAFRVPQEFNCVLPSCVAHSTSILPAQSRALPKP